MQGTLLRIRQTPASARITLDLVSKRRATFREQPAGSSALVRPYGTSRTAKAARSSPKSQPSQRQPKPAGSALQPVAWRQGGALGQARMSLAQTSDGQSADATRYKQAVHDIKDAAINLNPADYKSWEQVLALMQNKHGKNGIWSTFTLMQSNSHVVVLANADAVSLRDDILAAALTSDERLAALVEVAQRLRIDSDFQWPDLYMKVMHHFLDLESYDQAIRWHLHLAPNFLLETSVFGALLASFVVNPTPQMQSSLTSLYVFNTDHKMYDYIVPSLFISGQSKLARSWRKKFLLFEDLPGSAKARPFLRFLASYFPGIELSEAELAAAGLVRNRSSINADVDQYPSSGPTKGIYTDAIMARWFASAWTSVEFAINLVHRLGLRTIGPLALQSLALREPDARGVAAHVTQLEKLGIKISTQAYCKILVVFAKNGEDKLLADLLRCDIHPDEFDDVETRQMILAASARDGDWRRERLFQRIEWALETGPAGIRLNSLLSKELSRNQITKAKTLLDRMEALKVDVIQPNATRLLDHIFRGISDHPSKSKHNRDFGSKRFESHLNRAIEVTRQLAVHDVAIPIQYWKTLLYNLGRLGRFDELEQLSLEIVQIYTPSFGGLIPVHRSDLPLTGEVKVADKEKALVGREILTENRKRENESRMSMLDDGKRSNEERGDTQKKMDSFDAMALKMTKLRRTGNSVTSNSDSTTPKYPGPETTWTKIDHANYRRMKRKEAEAAQVARNIYNAEEKEYIPADLSFAHREHPLQKIFDPHLQRSIARWGFDQKLASEPQYSTLLEAKSSSLSSSAFDIACGVRILAQLRDRGVLIETQLLRTTIITRLAVAQLPGRNKIRARDSNEMSPENVKRLVEQAWGAELLSEDAKLSDEVESQKPKLWARYNKLLSRSYDQRQFNNRA